MSHDIERIVDVLREKTGMLAAQAEIIATKEHEIARLRAALEEIAKLLNRAHPCNSGGKAATVARKALE